MEHAPNAVDIHESNQLGKPPIGKRADRNPERRVIRAVSLAAPNRVLPRIRDLIAGKPVLEGVPVYSDQCRSPFFPNKYTSLVYLIKAPDYRAVALGLRGRQAPCGHPSGSKKVHVFEHAAELVADVVRGFILVLVRLFELVERFTVDVEPEQPVLIVSNSEPGIEDLWGVFR